MSQWCRTLTLPVLLFFFLPLMPMRAGAGLKNLERALEKEQQKAEERADTLERLTVEERKLDQDLAAAEQQIVQLENSLLSYRQKLHELVVNDESERLEYERILKEQQKTEQAMLELVRFLWELSGRHISAGGREMGDWAHLDREYSWSADIYAALLKHRRNLDEQESDLSRLLGRRERISREVGEYVQKANTEKARLLKARVSYTQRLASVRQKRTDAEKELASILALLENMHLQVQSQQGEIKNLKGKLALPVAGKIERSFNLNVSPPYRGIGLRTAEKAPVSAVAPGLVAHNDVVRGFGHVVILQHKDDYYTLYAFLQESDLKVGTLVDVSQQLGTAGFYPLLNSPGIYFELRHRQKVMNPQEWLNKTH